MGSCHHACGSLRDGLTREQRSLLSDYALSLDVIALDAGKNKVLSRGSTPSLFGLMLLIVGALFAVLQIQPLAAQNPVTQVSNPPDPSGKPAVDGQVASATNGKDEKQKATPSAQASPATDNNGKGEDNSGSAGGPMLRTIVGFEQAGVSAAPSQQDFFLDLYYDRPLALDVDKDLGPALRSWGNLRISSVPQQINTSVAQFAAEFAQQVGQLKVNQVAQSFEFLGGVEYRFWASPKKPNDYASTDPKNDPDTHNRVSAHLILGGGVITPLNPQQSVQVFDVPSNQPSFFTQYPQAVGKQYVAFTLLDRNRFFRQAYGGFRLKTNFLGDSTRTRFPETFDVTYGVNESITGGTIRGGVMRLEGFVPLPYSKASWVYLFGTGLFKLGSAATSSPFFLDQATGILPTNANAVIIATPQTNRDYYRIGIGIDFVDLIKNWGAKTNDQKNAGSKPGSGS